LLCERVIQEKDGTLTVIRIVDRVEIQMQTNIPNLPEVIATVQLTGLICIKSGPAKGKGLLTIDGEQPSGKIKRLGEFPLDLQGGENGQNVILNITMATKENGLHWFNVCVDNQTISKIPLIVERTQGQVVMVEQTSESPKSA
jgi:hypothetical protein